MSLQGDADGDPSVSPTSRTTTWAEALEAYRHPDLRQALFDKSVFMEDVLINLHGPEHRERRRMESPIFRRSQLMAYERDEFPDVVRTTLAPHLTTGRCELLAFGHRVMLNLSCVNAGIDRDLEDPDQTEGLLAILDEFVEGARIDHHQGDKDAKRAEIAAALAEFERDFVAPSIRSRRHGDVAGSASKDPKPAADVLSILLARPELDTATITHELAFYLTAGASTSAITLTNTFDNIFRYVDSRSDGRRRLLEDAAFLRRCIQETLRLSPISPIGARRAMSALEIGDRHHLDVGARLDIDIAAANRDPSVFGTAADEFDPDREVPTGAQLHGLSFGHGAHRCLGAELAVGLEPDPESGFDDRLFGLVGVVAQDLLRHDIRPDPDHPSELDTTTARHAFRRFPVLLGA